MLLELKIQELRGDITVLTSGEGESSYKGMVRKLNEELKRSEARTAQQKASHGKCLMLEKQVAELKSKLDSSEMARKQLAHEL
ncbi:unnamed protein product [Sphagnum balticum]